MSSLDILDAEGASVAGELAAGRLGWEDGRADLAEEQ